MANDEFEPGFVIRVTIECDMEGTRIIVFENVIENSFGAEKAKIERRATALKQVLESKHPGQIIKTTVLAAIKYGENVYIKA